MDSGDGVDLGDTEGLLAAIQDPSPVDTGTGNDEGEPEGGEMMEEAPVVEPEPAIGGPDRSVADLETIRRMCETYCYRLNLDANPRIIQISQGLAERAYVLCRLVAPSRACIAAFSVLSISRLTRTPRSLSRVSEISGVDSAEIDGLVRHIWRAPSDPYLVNLLVRRDWSR